MSWGNQTKNSSSYSNQPLNSSSYGNESNSSVTLERFLIDDTFLFLTDGTFQLLLQDVSFDPWVNQAKS